jgi:hypothetical protein
VPVFEEIVEDALTTVRLVPRWDLEPEEWQVVQAALERLDRSVATRDARGVRQALEDIEAHGPTRLAAIPRATAASPVRRELPQGVLDLVNTLIHPSATWTSSTQGTSRGSGQGT